MWTVNSFIHWNPLRYVNVKKMHFGLWAYPSDGCIYEREIKIANHNVTKCTVPVHGARRAHCASNTWRRSSEYLMLFAHIHRSVPSFSLIAFAYIYTRPFYLSPSVLLSFVPIANRDCFFFLLCAHQSLVLLNSSNIHSIRIEKIEDAARK